MGLTDSPYRSLQLMIKAKHVSYGDRLQEGNPFGWEKVVLNLPGGVHYTTELPWVMKVRADGHLACELYIYVDDGRVTGWSRLECWRAVRRFCATCNSLGIQDAARKRTAPSLTPGPWAGTVTHTKTAVVATVSEVKWQKVKDLIEELEEMMKHPEVLPHKRLEQIRGFLIYVSRTYRWMPPYLKGIHLTLDGWRPDRDAHGYRVQQKKPQVPSVWEWESEAWIDVDMNSLDPDDLEAPETVRAAPRLRDDINALQMLTEGSNPA